VPFGEGSLSQAHDRQALPLEFWFEFGSCYSYLSVMRIEALAARAGVQLLWRPLLLGPIFKALGFSTSPFLLQREKGTYVWRDMERESAKYGLGWRRPREFPRRALLPARVALLGADRGAPWVAEFSRRVMQLNFVEDRGIDVPETIAAVLGDLGLAAAALLAAAQSEENKRRLREQTEEAARRGIFGAPTFLIGSEMFWGNDRLEDALAFAARSV
jgi:2-hydroxychromene-2-carboxylate isomerase